MSELFLYLAIAIAIAIEFKTVENVSYFIFSKI
ncbi:MAG: hypothetical protein CENE_00517 [Candidatus Celerinatantimonas neptuna]|nr:MAG: hypothetical protein CENE_00517 [Candidatus Celerinatantimonas neptuna]